MSEIARVTWCSEEFVTHLLDRGETPLNILVCYGAASDFIEKLIVGGADFNETSSMKCAAWTPFHSAAYYNRVDLMRFMVERGASPHSRTGLYKWTVLHTAVMNPYYSTDAVGYLLSIGADINAKDLYGETPLDIARKGVIWYKRDVDKAMVEYLESLGAK